VLPCARVHFAELHAPCFDIKSAATLIRARDAWWS
jgi:hypothetical protein